MHGRDYRLREAPQMALRAALRGAAKPWGATPGARPGRAAMRPRMPRDPRPAALPGRLRMLPAHSRVLAIQDFPPSAMSTPPQPAMARSPAWSRPPRPRLRAAAPRAAARRARARVITTMEPARRHRGLMGAAAVGRTLSWGTDSIRLSGAGLPLRDRRGIPPPTAAPR